ncbi:cytidylyltransferase domain-containing protein [Magnetospirillum fulvum]|uniref:N-acylneuraminate cytidylyltransferase n=1 Tax=Magnetospirillum fulvum TaxID=1082 RepID=A0A1H6IZE6_MAGFU|nr:acylneuraminate cytidylyltransferase family protein [Magnetospirillum fulvum]SEH53640.1 N-acylneuraminate cytidylyltransferase [Magnetospirillum fulvum]
MKRLAVIPARGGSKGIPRKNLARIGGHPLLTWTVAAALESGCLDRVIVSTDDTEIAAVARDAGAEVPFLRPAELARDDTPSLAVVTHMVAALAAQGWEAEMITLLQPTSPFRTGADIRACHELRLQNEASAAVSVVECEAHPAWAFVQDEAGRLHPFLPGPMPTRRQDLPPAFRPNGAIFMVTRERLDGGATFYGPDTLAYVMPPERSIDIDTPWDLHLARLLAADAIQAGESPSRETAIRFEP